MSSKSIRRGTIAGNNGRRGVAQSCIAKVSTVIFTDRSQVSRVESLRIADGPVYGDVLIVKETGTGSLWNQGAVTIYISMKLDPIVLGVARDAVLEGDKKLAKSVLEQLGSYAGIGGAIVEAQAKRLLQAQKGKTSRQLDREIDDFLRERTS